MKKVIALILCCMVVLTGCSRDLSETKVVLTTGFGSDEVFRIDDVICTLPELMVYLVNMQNEYENSFGSGIWNVDVGDESLADEIKNNCLARIAQIKSMNLLAEQMEIVLDTDEEKKAASAAKEYYESLNAAEIAAMGNVTQEDIENLYKEYALAEKLYQYIIKDINPEISDDEARTITVEQIYLKTYSIDKDGNKVAYSDEQKAEVYNTAKSILYQINAGSSFEELMEQYNEASEGTISFGKGDKEESYEEAAFNLEKGEVSGVVELSDGYVILQCVSTFNKEETEANKVKIVEERKKEVFGEQYDDFVETLTRELNTNLWEQITLPDDEEVVTDSFFDVYEKYFASEFTS